MAKGAHQSHPHDIPKESERCRSAKLFFGEVLLDDVVVGDHDARDPAHRDREHLSVLLGVVGERLRRRK